MHTNSQTLDLANKMDGKNVFSKGQCSMTWEVGGVKSDSYLSDFHSDHGASFFSNLTASSPYNCLKPQKCFLTTELESNNVLAITSRHSV